MTFLTGTGRHRVQIVYFFRMQIGSRTPSGIGLGSGSRLHRMRQHLGVSRELWIEIFGKSWSSALERKGPVLICIHRWKRPRMRYKRLSTSSTDPKRPRGDLRTANRQDSGATTDTRVHGGTANPKLTPSTYPPQFAAAAPTPETRLRPLTHRPSPGSASAPHHFPEQNPSCRRRT